MEKIERKLKENIMMTFIPNLELSRSKWLYNRVVIDFDRKKVDVYDDNNRVKTNDNRRLGDVMGTLHKSGKYVYLAAFETNVTNVAYQNYLLNNQSNPLNPAIENVAFCVNWVVWATFCSNLTNLDDRRLKVGNYCMPKSANFIFTEGKNLTFREAMDVADLKCSYDYYLSAWVAFDEDGNIVDPHVCATWKPYEYVSATGKYLYYNLDCINDAFRLRDSQYFCGVVHRLSTGELCELHLRIDDGWSFDDEMHLSQEDVKILLKDEKIAKQLEGNILDTYRISNRGREIYCYKCTLGTLMFVDSYAASFTYCASYHYRFALPDLAYDGLGWTIRPQQIWLNPDLEVIDLKDYWRYPRVAHFTKEQYCRRFFVCGLMRQKLTNKIFYLVADFLCECKENGLFLSPEDLQTLLKDDIVAEQFEGKSFWSFTKKCFMFWDFKKKCYMSITDRKLHEKSKPDGKSHFVLRDENGVIFDEIFEPSDWELIFPQAEKTV